MARIYITRYGSNPVYGTFGDMVVEVDKPSGQSETLFRCYTVERPWLDNRPFVSCIPAGRYRVEHTVYHRGGYPALEIMNVLGRTRILIHRANHMLELMGCIGVGRTLGYVYGKWAVGNSATAFKQLMSVLEKESNIELFIRWDRPEMN